MSTSNSPVSLLWQSCSHTGVAFLHLLFFQLVNWSILRNTTFYPALQAFLLFNDFQAYICLTILCGVRLKSGFFAEETRSGLVEMTGMDRRNIYSHFRQAQISLPCKLEVLLDTYSSRAFIAGPKTSSS